MLTLKNILQKLVLFVVMGLSCVSCATVINGTTQRIPISSDPIGAQVFVDGMLVGRTPVTIEVKRKYSHLITLSADGYEEAAVQVNPVLSAAVAGNIIAGGFIGWGVDAVNGAQYRLMPETVYVKLMPFAYLVPNPYFQPPYVYPSQ